MAGLPHRTRGGSKRSLLIWVLVLGFVILVAGRPLYWYMINHALRLESCSPCECDCSQSDEAQSKALTELTHTILPNCEKDIDDPDMLKEVRMRRYQILRDALRLQELKAEEAQLQSQKALVDVRKMAAQYRKELGKCVEGMMTTEFARQTATGALKREKELSSLWEARARELGWKDEGEGTSNN